MTASKTWSWTSAGHVSCLNSFKFMKFYILLVLILSSVSAFAGDRWEPDNQDVINFKLGLLGQSLNLGFKPADKDDAANVNYLPSPYTKSFVALGYRNLGLYLSVKNPSRADDKNKYGNSESTDFQLSFFGRRWTQAYFYQIYKGYYIENSAQINPVLAPETFLQRDDLKTIHYGGSFIYNFQPENYSIGASYAQSGRQIESGGAWLAMAGIHNHSLRGNSQFIPTQVSAKYGELSSLESEDIMQASIAGGGGYNWSFWQGGYVAFQALIGVGSAYEHFETADAYYDRWAPGYVANAMVSFGYNGKDNYLVITSASDTSTYNLNTLSIELNSTQYSLHYGHRFSGMDLPLFNKFSAWFD
jgi:hypothetical protein